MSTATFSSDIPMPHEYRPDATFRAMIRTFGLLRRVQEPFFNRFGISASQWGVLRALHRAEQEDIAWLRLTDLGNRLVIRPPSVTGVVDRLQRMGLLLRTSLPQDRRAKRVSLTPAGRERVLQVLSAMPKQVGSIIDVLSADQRETLKNILNTVEAHLQTMASQLEASAQKSEDDDDYAKRN